MRWMGGGGALRRLGQRKPRRTRGAEDTLGLRGAGQLGRKLVRKNRVRDLQVLAKALGKELVASVAMFSRLGSLLLARHAKRILA